jgi:hypothetical protein
LGSSFQVPDLALKDHMEKLIKVFQFYNGPIQSIQQVFSFKNSLIFKRYDDRVEYLKYMEKACGELKILALHYSSNPNYVFEPIPYFELPIVRDYYSLLEKQFCLYFFDSILEIFIEC